MLFIIALLFKITSIAVRRKQYASKAAALGCSRLPVLPRKGFLGLGRLTEVAKANKEGRTPQWFMEKFDELGEDVHTFIASALDFELIVTRDPENVRTMFQTSKSDSRSPFFLALLPVAMRTDLK